jgi:hypothetical protein
MSLVRTLITCELSELPTIRQIFARLQLAGISDTREADNFTPTGQKVIWEKQSGPVECIFAELPLPPTTAEYLDRLLDPGHLAETPEERAALREAADLEIEALRLRIQAARAEEAKTPEVVSRIKEDAGNLRSLALYRRAARSCTVQILAPTNKRSARQIIDARPMFSWVESVPAEPLVPVTPEIERAL